MKKIICFLLALILLSASLPAAVYAAENVTLTKAGFATVVQIIDGQTIKVKPYETQDTALVRLVCVDADGNGKAAAYLNEKLMGKLVSLAFDPYVASPDGRFNVMVVTCDEIVINKEMLEKGYATENANHTNAAMLKNLNVLSATPSTTSTANTYVRSSDIPYRRNGKTYYYMNNQFYEYKNGSYIPSDEWFDVVYEGYTGLLPPGLGYYDNNGRYYPYEYDYYHNYPYYYDGYYYPYDGDYPYYPNYPYYYGDYSYYPYDGGYSYYPYYPPNTTYQGSGLNINTATQSQIQGSLTGITSTLARNIIDYRDDNGYFNYSDELRFVPGITSALFYQNIGKITVCTNINTATRSELLTLSGVKAADADRIIEYRTKKKFTNKTQLYTESLISRAVYDLNSRFVSVSDRDSVD